MYIKEMVYTMKEIDCCYNCKYFCTTLYLGDVWVCIESQKKVTHPLDDSFFSLNRVKPNNICEKWEHRK